MIQKIFIGGIGSLGSWLFRALIFREELKDYGFLVADYDRVEERNVGNQIYTIGQVGMYKTQAMAQTLIDLDMRNVLSRIEFLTGRIDRHFNLPSDICLVVDCFDSYESRKDLSSLAESAGTDVIHCGFGMVGGKPIAKITVNDLSDFRSGNEEDVCDLKEFSGFFQGVGAIFANCVVDFIVKGKWRKDLTVGYNLQVKNN